MIQLGVLLTFGLGMIVYGWRIGLRSKRLNEELNKYEFENRTPGGVVQFASYEASKSHEARRMKAGTQGQFTILLLLLGFLVVLVSGGIFLDALTSHGPIRIRW